MKRTDLIGIFFLILTALVIYYPIFHADYLYTDECVQLWYGSKGLNFNTSVPQGRFITYKLFTWLFSSIHTTHGVIFPRAVSLLGWMASLPIWYFITSKVVVRNGLPRILAFLSCSYLVCMPPFAISVGWSACMELFIACTAGLVSGYAFYSAITNKEKSRAVPTTAIVISLFAGLLSLFTYQSGFCCFLIPFFIHFVGSKKITRTTVIGMGGCLLIYLVYYLLFRYSLGRYGLEPSDRGALSFDPYGKMVFFFSRPMATAFHFTRLFNEKSVTGLIVYSAVAAAWLIAYLFRQRKAAARQKLFYLLGLLAFFLLLDLPSLIVKENYSSNRTLLALDLAVFFLVADAIFAFLKEGRTRAIATVVLATLFLVNAWYNFNKEFLDPLTAEYQAIRATVSSDIGPGTTRVYFIRPPENLFEKRYGIIPSWDEFGLPSTAMPWTPEPLIKQLIFEKTGGREKADAITIRSWPVRNAFLASGDTLVKGTVLIDASTLISE